MRESTVALVVFHKEVPKWRVLMGHKGPGVVTEPLGGDVEMGTKPPVQ